MPFSLLQPLRDVPIAVVDTETSGASAAYGDRIIEIGIARVENGQIVAEYQRLIDPHRAISWGVSALTGITQEMVSGQPRFAELVPEMLPLLQGAAILGHNIRFDLSFLHAEFRRAGQSLTTVLGHGPNSRVPVLDTVRIARRQFGRGGNSLSVLSRRLGIDPVTSHRALADAVTTAKLFGVLMTPAGGYNCSLCDALTCQGGAIDLATAGTESLLPLELEEALESRRPVLMEYLDGRGSRTERLIQPLHIKRVSGELTLVAHCHLRDDRRTFKLDRIVQLKRVDGNSQLPPNAEACPPEAPASSDQPLLPFQTSDN